MDEADPEEEEPVPPPLHAFPLHLREGRLGFLRALADYHGEAGLFAAVAHVWASLAPPEEVRCAVMAQRAGCSGRGKVALRRVLRRFLCETFDCFERPALWRDVEGMEAMHAAFLAHAEAIAADMDAVAARYETILDGRDPAAPPPTGIVVIGPWRGSGA
ncbi:hypothetical protein [Rubellimicrobium sp. CFH 75288]|uniref:hypothetical protein n=1 Tax=Rubellimicrobium sp. CFH 75288 TaxID=2697034 RepID=UPI001412A401|nr:hypothetical protein [Rubellimicrobium sp. CFH 75288]NAZ36155.1 hypothetical protein [Rubellimicrobium sp. CFH 75288]